MKLGVSTYSLHQAYQSGELSLEQVIAFIAEAGGDHVEIVPIGYNLVEQPELITTIKNAAAASGLEISNYAIGANFADLSDADYRAEIDRVKQEVDAAAALGVKRMRHDVANSSDLSITNFLNQLPKLAAACQEIADHAKQYDIITSVENHGLFIQHSDRVQALVKTTDRDNFKTTLDIGNFLCVDEISTAAVQNNIGIASMVHIKDFLYRPKHRAPGAGWFNTSHGNWLRGTIAGHGDVDMVEVLRIVKASGYDGYFSLEFEGMENCKDATKIGLANVRRIWESV